MVIPSTADTEYMFSIHCPLCDQNHLVDTKFIEAFDNTDHGPVAVVRCLNGHRVVTDFGRGLATV